MAAIERFEDIESWKKARELTRTIYKLTSQGDFARDYGLRDQMRRSAVSIMSNIAEGFERGGNKEFQQFLALAKGSAGEFRAQLYVALDAGLLIQKDFDYLYQLVSETSRLISGFMTYLNDSPYKGHKFN